MTKIEYIGKCLLVETKENEEKKRILVIGDLHLGYEEHLNRIGVFVSRKMFEEMIAYLNKVFERVEKVDRIVLLGDVKHDFGSIMGQEWNDVLDLLDYLNKKVSKNGKIVIIKGNHDKIIEPIANKREVGVLDCYTLGEFCFLHGDKEIREAYDKDVRYWVLGHGHPAVKIAEPGGAKIEKYKCFLVGKFKQKKIIILPSFIEANEGSDPRENNLGLGWNFDLGKFHVKIVSDDLEVLDFGELRRL